MIALNIPAGDARGREVIAMRIIDLARRGVIDPKRLRNRVLFEARSGVDAGITSPILIIPARKTARILLAPCSSRGVNR